jgi:hypothetical protein
MNKKYSYFIVGCAAAIVTYMTTADKFVILMPGIIAGLYFLLSHGRVCYVYSYTTLALSISLLGLLAVSPNPGSVLFSLSSLLMWRTVGNGGYISMWYYDYFSTHSQTYYSHVGAINFFTHSYPYENLGLGQVIGKHYWNSDMNANANFWATDGFAAYGVGGVIIISIVFVFFLIFLNTITKKFGKLFLLLLFIPFSLSLLNASFFQSLWSGGGIFIILLLLFTKNTYFIRQKNIKT